MVSASQIWLMFFFNSNFHYWWLTIIFSVDQSTQAADKLRGGGDQKPRLETQGQCLRASGVTERLHVNMRWIIFCCGTSSSQPSWAPMGDVGAKCETASPPPSSKRQEGQWCSTLHQSAETYQYVVSQHLTKIIYTDLSPSSSTVRSLTSLQVLLCVTYRSSKLWWRTKKLNRSRLRSWNHHFIYSAWLI